MLIISYIKTMWVKVTTVFILSILFLFFILKIMSGYNQYSLEYNVDFSKFKEISRSIRYNFVEDDHGMITYNYIWKNSLGYTFLTNYAKVVDKYDVPIEYYNFKENVVDKNISFVSHSGYESVVVFSHELNKLIYQYYKTEYDKLLRRTIQHKIVLLTKAKSDIRLLQNTPINIDKQLADIKLLQFDINELREVRRILSSDDIKLWDVEVDIKEMKLEKHNFVAMFALFLIQIIFITLSFINFKENYEK